MTCKQGYSTFNKNGKNDFVCVKAIIPNCVVEARVTKGFDVCLVCDNDRYPFSGKGETSFICKKLTTNPPPAPHCIWGTFIEQGAARCDKCAPGYAVDAQDKLCVKNTIKGCQTLANVKECDRCDGLAGYSINKDAQCVKTTTTK